LSGTNWLRRNGCRRCGHCALDRWRSVTGDRISAYDKLHIAGFDDEFIARTAVDDFQYLGDFLIS
jgi:hypothetical protein